MFFWIFKSFSAMLSVDLSMKIHYTDSSGNITIISTMCGMSQFVVIVSVLDGSSTTLASCFIQNVLMKLVPTHLTHLDNSSLFNGVFITMCQAFNSNYKILVKNNHKGIAVENFHRFSE